jgi:molybdopterin molybdotransferase
MARVSFEDAQQRIIAACEPLGTEMVSIAEAVGRVLAETLRAGADLVPFARSAMDGFALRAVDGAAGALLPVAGRAYAEPSAQRTHAAGTATQIATGAPIPRGADAVVPIENVVRENGSIRMTAALTPGTNVFPPGEDARAGDVLLERGRYLRAADAGLLAAAGHVRVPVYVRPVAAVLTTGDEVVAPDQTPGHGQIRNSNAALVAATLRAWGCAVTTVAHVRDDTASLRTALAAQIGACDLLLTTGGASVGERDLVKAELGGPFAFDSVALRPAKPTAFVCKGRTRVLVLPGNPSSAYVALHELARPAAMALAGRTDVTLPRITATLAGRVHAKAERTYAAYARVNAGDTGFVAVPLDNQCSALTRTASDAQGFIVVPPGSRDYESGDRVRVDIVDWTGVVAGEQT